MTEAGLSLPGRKRPPPLLIAGALLALCAAAAGAGATSLGFGAWIDLAASLWGVGEIDPVERAVLLSIRLPRVALGAMHGVLLACSGALLQGLFRNPLADPGLLGTSGGAMLAACAWTVLGAPLLPQAGIWALPVAAFAGALLSTAMVLRLGGGAGRGDAGTLLLSGVAVNAIAFAATSLLLSVATDGQLRSITFWSLGSLGGSNWPTAALLALPVVLVGMTSMRLAPRLDALLLGEREAAHLGVDVPALQRKLVVATALAVGASVAAAGTIGFVGLVVPNLMRLVFGPSHRLLLPASAAAGAALVVGADAVARTAVAPAELPIGVLTSMLGAPFFLHLLRRRVVR